MIWGSKHLAKSEHHSLQLLPGYKPEIIYFLWKLRRCCNIIAVFFQTLFLSRKVFTSTTKRFKESTYPSPSWSKTLNAARTSPEDSFSTIFFFIITCLMYFYTGRPPKKVGNRILMAWLGDKNFGPILAIQVILDYLGQFGPFWVAMTQNSGLLNIALKILFATFLLHPVPRPVHHIVS